MESVTKTRILESALVSFALNGYKGTNLRDLAAQLDLSKSALYRHFDGKEAIWNAVLDMMEAYYTERFGSGENLPKVPDSAEELVEMTMQMLAFTMHDEKVKLTRRLLLTEQFRDERARAYAAEHFLNGTKAMYTKVFEGMMEKGILKQDDPAMLAFVYTAPITELVHACDREPDKEPQFMDQITAFVRHFIRIYC